MSKTIEESARKHGIDWSLIEANLRLSPAERIRQHDRNLTLQERLRSAMEKRRVRPQ